MSAANLKLPGGQIWRITPEEQAITMKTTHVDRLIAREANNVHKVKAKDSTGRWACYFIYVPSTMTEVFLKRLKGDGMIDLETFGTVIASNYGEEPSPETREKLKSEYDFDV